MSKLTRGQRERVREMVVITNADEGDAAQLLREAGWNMEAAVTRFYDRPPPPQRAAKAASTQPDRILALFDEYASAAASAEDGDGGSAAAAATISDVERLAGDLRVDPDGVQMLVLAWQLGARRPGEFARQEWLDGLLALRCDTIGALRTKLGDVGTALARDRKMYRDFYSFVFDYAKAPGAKTLPTEVAVELWKVVLPESRFPLRAQFLQFLEEQRQRCISRDLWVLMLEFGATVATDLSNYDENSSWPVLLDSFVAWMRPRLSSAGAPPS